MTWTINNNVATEITWLQKNMVATLEESGHVWDFSSTLNLWEFSSPSPMTVRTPRPQLLKSSLQGHIFFQLPLFNRREVHSMIHFSTPLSLAILSYIFRIVISVTVALISILSLLFIKIATTHCLKSVHARSSLQINNNLG